VSGLLFVPILALAVLVGLVFLGIRLWRNNTNKGPAAPGLDLIPYLLLALAVGVAVFSLARLARASLESAQLAGQPSSDIALALAGIVVAGPLAVFLWRRQAKRRVENPETPGWGIYLSLIEIVFLTAFFVTTTQVANSLDSPNDFGPAHWSNLVIYLAVVGFHWWVSSREPPGGDPGELYRLVGSGVALITMAGGAYGVLVWLFTRLYFTIEGSIDIPRVVSPIVLLIVATPIWAYRWLMRWPGPAGVFRNLYLALASISGLVAMVGAGVSIAALTLAYLLTDTASAGQHFDGVPVAASLVVTGGLVWAHHRRRFGTERSPAHRTYQYGMAAIALGALIGSATALVSVATAPSLIGGSAGSSVIALGLVVLVSGAIWHYFWKAVQTAAATETRTPQRRAYLLGMAVITGLTAAGALIATLVTIFRSLLDLGDVAVWQGMRIPLTLTVLSGLAFWHLFTHIRADDDLLPDTTTEPFSVMVICSHPGRLATQLPAPARIRVIYRADDEGVVTEEMASEIAAAVGTSSSLVWVDADGYRVAPLREL
jgi:Domain of unknown function (DUF5671)